MITYHFNPSNRRKEKKRQLKNINVRLNDEQFYPYLVYAYHMQLTQMSNHLIESKNNHLLCNQSDVLFFNLALNFLNLTSRKKILDHVNIRYRTLPRLRNFQQDMRFLLITREEYQSLFSLNMEVLDVLTQIHGSREIPYLLKRQRDFTPPLHLLIDSLQYCYAERDSLSDIVGNRALNLSDDFTLYYKVVETIGESCEHISSDISRYVHDKLKDRLEVVLKTQTFEHFSITGQALNTIVEYKDTLLNTIAI